VVCHQVSATQARVARRLTHLTLPALGELDDPGGDPVAAAMALTGPTDRLKQRESSLRKAPIAAGSGVPAGTSEAITAQPSQAASRGSHRHASVDKQHFAVTDWGATA
jgi:hypothetical protein